MFRRTFLKMLGLGVVPVGPTPIEKFCDCGFGNSWYANYCSQCGKVQDKVEEKPLNLSVGDPCLVELMGNRMSLCLEQVDLDFNYHCEIHLQCSFRGADITGFQG